MVLLAWPLVFWVGRFFGLLVLLLALFCLFFFLCGSFLYAPCVLLGALFSFVKYIAFIDKTKKVCISLLLVLTYLPS